MRTTTLAAAALLVAGLPAAASAAPKKPLLCMQIQDPSGDASLGDAVPTPSFDILSADVATGQRALVAAIRLSTLDNSDAQAGGATYVFQFDLGGTRHQLMYSTYATGQQIGRYDPDVKNASGGDEIVVPVVADVTTRTITWTVSRNSVAALRKPGGKLSGFGLSSVAGVNYRVDSTSPSGPPVTDARYQLAVADSAQGLKAYTDLTPTCLKGA